MKLRPLWIPYSTHFETLNLLHLGSHEMFTLFDVSHKTHQKKMQANSQESTVQTGNHLQTLLKNKTTDLLDQ